jgi:hypothetical protein
MTKKKKRPLANPARGFATTSVASKPKPEKESTDRIEAEAEKDDAEIDETPAKRGFKLQAATHTSVTKVSSTSVKQQQHLTPQELEEQLERDDLQLFVEKHAAKIARDAARQILKVQTDCRVLRAQSQYLAADQWLPDELLQEILDFSRRELQEADHTDNAPSSKTFSEETTVARLWSLQLTLLNLGVPKTRIFELFTALLSRDPKPDSGSFVWGFRESLDLLSLDERNSFLPAYDGQRGASEFETQNTIIEGEKRQVGTALCVSIQSTVLNCFSCLFSDPYEMNYAIHARYPYLHVPNLAILPVASFVKLNNLSPFAHASSSMKTQPSPGGRSPHKYPPDPQAYGTNVVQFLSSLFLPPKLPRSHSSLAYLIHQTCPEQQRLIKSSETKRTWTRILM